MSALVKLLVGALLDWLVRETPTFIAYLERRAAARQAQAQHEKNAAAIDRALLGGLPAPTGAAAEAGPDPRPAQPPAIPGRESVGP